MTCRKCGESILIRGKKPTGTGSSGSYAGPAPRAHSSSGSVSSAPQGSWHVAIRDNPIGPLTRDQVAIHIAKGDLSETSLCWTQGMTDWKPIGTIAELSSLFRERRSVPPAAPKTSMPPPAPAASLRPRGGVTAPPAPAASIRPRKAVSTSTGLTPPAAAVGASMAPAAASGAAVALAPAAEAETSPSVAPEPRHVPSSGPVPVAPAGSQAEPLAEEKTENDPLDSLFPDVGASSPPASAPPAAAKPLMVDTLLDQVRPQKLVAAAASASSPPPAESVATAEPVIDVDKSRRSANTSHSVSQTVLYAAIAMGVAFGLMLGLGVVFGWGRYAADSEPQLALNSPATTSAAASAFPPPQQVQDLQAVQAAQAAAEIDLAPPVDEPALAADSTKKPATQNKARRGRSKTKDAPAAAKGGQTLSAEEQKMLARMGASAAATPSLKLAKRTSSGGAKRAEFDGALAGKVVKKNRKGLQRCYERAIRGNPSPPAIRLDVFLTVAPAGNVSRVSTKGNDVGGLKNCVTSSVKRWRFPASAGGSTKFPLVFQGA